MQPPQRYQPVASLPISTSAVVPSEDFYDGCAGRGSDASRSSCSSLRSTLAPPSSSSSVGSWWSIGREGAADGAESGVRIGRCLSGRDVADVPASPSQASAGPSHVSPLGTLEEVESACRANENLVVYLEDFAQFLKEQAARAKERFGDDAVRSPAKA
mmetsp:Transcript_89792/g.258942  ORF Transcript_89792/g.258942 Transcript_89792/m.258942 type:complete len:158 (+) Transcript_89792:392-865(+)